MIQIPKADITDTKKTSGVGLGYMGSGNKYYENCLLIAGVFARIVRK